MSPHRGSDSVGHKKINPINGRVPKSAAVNPKTEGIKRQLTQASPGLYITREPTSVLPFVPSSFSLLGSAKQENVEIYA